MCRLQVGVMSHLQVIAELPLPFQRLLILNQSSSELSLLREVLECRHARFALQNLDLENINGSSHQTEKNR